MPHPDPRLTPGSDPRWADFEYRPGVTIAVPATSTTAELEAITADHVKVMDRIQADWRARRDAQKGYL